MASQWGNCGKKVLTNLGINDTIMTARNSNIERIDNMKITIKKYVARVAEFIEHEDGSITKETREIVLNGQRFTPETALRAIPRNYQLIDSGWKETVYEVDTGKLEMFCKEYGKQVSINRK